MDMTDPIADMLTRIRNAQAVKKDSVVLPMSKIKLGIAKILEEQKLVEKVEIVKSKFNEIRIELKYNNGRPAISNLKKISTPGRRIYAGKGELPRVLNNLGIAIISTPRGLMTNKQAKQQGIGGEVICEIF
ncbi:MAG: 30S ribosomal protein S8 [bacterium]|nr:30S ribosomal protein S8 [bacterium]